ncbi:hypothetical protein F4823DRAFT_625011 [Ustulina deusta]|nr:hypothetical protein F4823DRAFT_625011 [Ustulina deusta]
MNSCFSDDFIEPMQIIDIPREKLFSESCVSLNDLELGLKPPNCGRIDVRFISACQRNSWRPLQITRSMFKFIIDHHGLNESAYELSSCFYTRSLDLEDAYCAPLSIVRSGDFLDISYTLRYPEFKEKENRWALHQSGIYHWFNQKTNQHFLLLLSPLPNSAAHVSIENQLLNRRQSVLDDPLWAQGLLFSTYIPAWRQYIAWLEGRLIPIIPTLISHSLDVLDSLSRHSTAEKISNTPVVQQLENCRRQTAAYSRTAACLHQRAQTTAKLLSATLSLREQTIAKDQAETMASLSKSTYWITIMGLLYLPTTLVVRREIVASTDIWYFFVASGVLTFTTLFACYGFRGHGTIIPRQAFPAAKWWGITMRWGIIRKRSKGSLHASSV